MGNGANGLAVGKAPAVTVDIPLKVVASAVIGAVVYVFIG